MSLAPTVGNVFEDWLGTGLASTLVAATALVVGAVVLFYVARQLLLPMIARFGHSTRFRWDDLFADQRVQRWTSLFVVAIAIHLSLDIVPGMNDFWQEFWTRVTAGLAIFCGAFVVNTLLMAFNTVYETLPLSRERPMKGYLQVVQLIVYIFADIWIISVLANQTPWYLLSGLGAAAAVLLLLYRETIMSLAASVQIAQNDVLRVGDWIEMPQYGANGTVVDMALVTVKVRNWDNTITTVPTHKLTSESFKNWRGMADVGSRRIRFAINLDISTIHFFSGDRPEDESEGPAAARTRSVASAPSWLTDGAGPGSAGASCPTNVDALQRYLRDRLREHPDLETETMPFMVRQLPPGPSGLPLEIYVFCRHTKWQDYEAVKGEVISHALAVLSHFGLRAFQEPTDAAIRARRSD